MVENQRSAGTGQGGRIGDVRCDYFEAGACRSCARLATPYAAQLAAKDAAARALLAEHRSLSWDDPLPSAESGFRAKAKMAVGGTPQAPTLGILTPDGGGVDLRGCPILGRYARAALPVLADFVTRQGLRPYDVAARTGELKQIHVVEAQGPDDSADPVRAEAMIRFVLRSEGQLGKIRRGLPQLADALAGVGLRPPRVIAVNLLPEHAALAEGPGPDLILTPEDTLPMPVGDVTLHLHPGAFLQTNTAVAGALYRQAAAWIAAAEPRVVLDLYCGAGGFALHAARSVSRGTAIRGAEVSTAAVAGARRSAAEAGLAVTFEVADATTYGLDPRAASAPDQVIVNPPRRGIGAGLAAQLQAAAEAGTLTTLLYSSCNPATLAADLRRMPALRPVRARLFDMFPHTDHAEVLVLSRRVTARGQASI